MHHVSESGLALIERYEGFRSKPYGPPADVWTIGYGETQGVSGSTGPWTQAYAEKRLRLRVRRDYEPYIHRLGLPLNQHQFDALVSCIYNLGPGILDLHRSLGDALRSRRDSGWVARVQDAIKEYDMPGSIFHEGLKARREQEAKLFGEHVLTKKQRNLNRWNTELARLRAEVRIKFHGDWGRAPKRKARADSIKRAIERTNQTAKKKGA